VEVALEEVEVVAFEETTTATEEEEDDDVATLEDEVGARVEVVEATLDETGEEEEEAEPLEEG